MKKENGCYPASLKDALALKDLFPGEEAFCPEKILLDNNKDMKNKNGQMEDSVTTDKSMKLTISCKKNVFDIEHLEFQYLENVPGIVVMVVAIILAGAFKWDIFMDN